MMRLGCVPTELLLERQSPPLSHAERLRVEQHLAECEDCRREHAAMLSLQAMVESGLPSATKSSVQDRAIARALLKAGKPERSEAPAALRPAARRRGGYALVAAAAIVAIGFAAAQYFEAAPRGEAVVEAREESRVTAGQLLLGDVALRAGQHIPDGRELHPQGNVTLALAHARVELEGVESLTWSSNERAVTLRAGVAEVDVDPSKHLSFRVVTSRFIVEVLGTHFRVAGDSVSVARGRVRVLSPEQAPLAELGPGQSWSLSVAAPTTSASAAPPAATRSTEPPVAINTAKSEPADSAGRAATLPVAELLARARHRLAGGDAHGARADLDLLLTGGASRAQQAEAYMLKGDCALVEGDAGGAVRAYLEVTRRFAGTRTAETALFAAARVESNRGNNAAAKELLQAYRTRYPAGQFRSDVDARLKMLDEK